MRIVLLTLTRGSVSGGFRKYLDCLVPLLRLQPGVESVEVFVPPQMVRTGDRTWPPGDDLRGFRELRRSVAALKPDVIFIPTARVLRAGRTPVVTMVRNMEPLEVPFGGNTLAEGLKNVARAAAARLACRRADRVIAVSGHVRDFLIRYWHIPEQRVGMVYHGIDQPGNQPVLPLMQDRFLFTAGSIRPARGLEDVIEALAELPEDLHLVIAGAVDRGAGHYAARMRSLAEHKGVSSRIRWAGHLDAASMSWCFRNAAAFVMTSRAEACPNVVLEAMANGAVSVSTSHPPMSEFFGLTADYYFEREARHLAVRLGHVLELPESAREERRAAARARAAHFTWQTTAKATVAELQKAIELRRAIAP
jgi:glycosyltransferase involved in cell wall biosynthesis